MAQIIGFLFATPQEAGPFRACLFAAGSIPKLPLTSPPIHPSTQSPIPHPSSLIPHPFTPPSIHPSIQTIEYGDRIILLGIVGIGGPRARVIAEEMLNAGAEWLVSAGLSGALRPELPVGSILQAAAVIDSHQNRWPAQPFLSHVPIIQSPDSPIAQQSSNPTSQQLNNPLTLLPTHSHTDTLTHASSSTQSPNHPITLDNAIELCLPRILTTRQEKQEARREWQADAVDMESALVAQVAAEREIAFSCVRAISDHSSETLALDFTPFVDKEGAVGIGRLILWLLWRPWRIPPLIRLAINTGSASRRLARHLVDILTTLQSADTKGEI